MKRFFKENRSKSAIALILVTIIALSCVLGSCKLFGQGGATDDSATIDEVNFVFPSGTKIAGADVSGMHLDAAFETVEAAAFDTVYNFELKVKAEEKEFSYGKDDFKWDYAIEDALDEAMALCESESNTESVPSQGIFVDVKTEVKADSVTKLVDEIAKEVDVKAVDSTFSVDGENVNISREKAGRQVDKADLTVKITSEIASLSIGEKKTATVEATVNDVAPQYKFESLDGKIELISTYSTWSTNTENGNNNMRVALEACNGSVINPGEVWSFNSCTGNSNLTSLGYLPATVIVNGKFEEGIGGGLCQASSTIYNAAILANMGIEERYCHQFQSSYVPAGRDATIDYPGLDLKLSNPTDYPMYMQCYMEGTELTVNIYGWNDPSFDYIEIESYVHSATKDDYKASAERVYYLDGEEVGRESLPSSSYDYPKDDDEPKPTKPKATKPAATKPKATKPVVTTPAETLPVTQVPTTIPVETLASDPVEETTVPLNTEATEATSKNEEQIETATAQY